MGTSDLAFPRTIYRGHPDHLGQGLHAHPETGELVGETKRCESADAFEQDTRDGWRLTREIPAVDTASDGVDDAPLDPLDDDAAGVTSAAPKKAKAKKAKAKK